MSDTGYNTRIGLGPTIVRRRRERRISRYVILIRLFKNFSSINWGQREPGPLQDMYESILRVEAKQIFRGVRKTSHHCHCDVICRVSHLLVGWVDLTMECTNVCPILSGLMETCQKRLGNLGGIPKLVKTTQVQVYIRHLKFIEHQNTMRS